MVCPATGGVSKPMAPLRLQLDQEDRSEWPPGNAGNSDAHVSERYPAHLLCKHQEPSLPRRLFPGRDHQEDLEPRAEVVVDDPCVVGSVCKEGGQEIWASSV